MSIQGHTALHIQSWRTTFFTHHTSNLAVTHSHSLTHRCLGIFSSDTTFCPFGWRTNRWTCAAVLLLFVIPPEVVNFLASDAGSLPANFPAAVVPGTKERTTVSYRIALTLCCHLNTLSSGTMWPLLVLVLSKHCKFWQLCENCQFWLSSGTMCTTVVYYFWH